MNRTKYLPRIVLAVGAAASVATSQVPVDPTLWSVSLREPLAARALDDTTPQSTRLVTAVLRTPDVAASTAGGSVAVHLELRGRDVTGVRAAEIDVEIASTSPSGDLERQRIAVAPGQVTTVDLLVSAFGACVSTPCTESFQLKLQRAPLADDPIIDVTGHLDVEGLGDGDVAPPGARIELELADIRSAP